MSTTSKSERDSRPKKPPEESKAEAALRQAGQRAEDWDRLGGCCGVESNFSTAKLSDYNGHPWKDWKEQVKAGGWLFTHGKVGTGKTHLLAALTRSRYIWAWTCWMVYVPEFLATIKSSFDSDPGDASDLVYRAKMTEFLAMDDLGTEKLTPWTQEVLTTIINARYAKGLATAISSNYGLEALAKRYERIADRIREKALVVPLEVKRPERGG